MARLTFQVKLTHRELWSAEPMEIEVKLSLTGPSAKFVSVPNEIDPGHSSFQIWITRPDGERFRFRPPVRFCQPNGEKTIKAGAPFRRDISIFRHLGTDTFSQPGKYAVQGAFRLFSGKWLLSNVERCEVLLSEPASAAWRAYDVLLRTEEVRNLLRYKRTPPSKYVYAKLVRFAKTHASDATASAIHYSLAKALVYSSARLSAGVRAKSLHERGRAHLRYALDHGDLSAHRACVAEAMLESNQAYRRTLGRSVSKVRE